MSLDLVVAVYDSETKYDPTKVGGWSEHERMGFAFGVVSWVHYRQNGAAVSRATLATNVYWSPVAMVDDLLRPWAHALCAYNGHRFDIPLLVSQAIAPMAGPYLGHPDPKAVAAVAGHLWTAGVQRFPLVRMEQEIPKFAHLPKLWDRFRAALMARWMTNGGLPRAMGHRLGEWMQRGADYSRLVPPGTTNLAMSRAELAAELQARTFDPLAWLGEESGNPHVAKLDYLREGLEREPWKLDGEVVHHGEIPRMWREGMVWQVVDCCRDDVDALSELLQQGLSGGRNAHINANQLNSTARNAAGQRVPMGATDQWISPHHGDGGLWKYRIPTAAWSGILEDIRRTRFTHG